MWSTGMIIPLFHHSISLFHSTVPFHQIKTPRKLGYAGMSYSCLALDSPQELVSMGKLVKDCHVYKIMKKRGSGSGDTLWLSGLIFGNISDYTGSILDASWTFFCFHFPKIFGRCWYGAECHLCHWCRYSTIEFLSQYQYGSHSKNYKPHLSWIAAQ